jgi:hypothetical protein
VHRAIYERTHRYRPRDNHPYLIRTVTVTEERNCYVVWCDTLIDIDGGGPEARKVFHGRRDKTKADAIEFGVDLFRSFGPEVVN